MKIVNYKMTLNRTAALTLLILLVAAQSSQSLNHQSNKPLTSPNSFESYSEAESEAPYEEPDYDRLQSNVFENLKLFFEVANNEHIQFSRDLLDEAFV